MLLEFHRGAFYENELTKIDLDLFDVERVLKRRTRRGVPQVLVKWVGYNAIFNSWIPAADLQNR